MLLKCTNSERKMIISSKGNGTLIRGSGMRMTMATSSTMTPRIHRKGFRTPSKRHPGKVLPGKLHSISRVGPGKIAPGKRMNPRPHPPPCDNSNDSGFGFDQNEIQNNQQIIRTVPSSRSNRFHDDDDDDDVGDGDYTSSNNVIHIEDDDLIENKSQVKRKRRRIQSIQIDTDDACSNDAFVQKIATTTAASNNDTYSTTKFITTMGRNNVRTGFKRPPSQTQTNISTASKDGSVNLQIISQPEQQHRARYQTEGSRGAVKDRSGNGFPIVKLIGYNKPAVLQVFIGTDIGRVAPHMFYQACKVAGKNSTPCNEKKLEGTMIIEIDFKPENDMTVTCDCVGILKERNVDVEHRFPEHPGPRSKKKSTRCRMVFRTQLTHDDGTVETLQVCSYPIICTQPPGVPEICKKSLNSCPVDGGLELFIIGKNFLKDTCIVFTTNIERSSDHDMASIVPTPVWEDTVFPDKEYLQQTHLVCVVPPYIQQNLVEPVHVQFFVMSSNKKSEPHNFMYTPKGSHTILSAATTLNTLHSTVSNQQDTCFTDNSTTQQQQQQQCSVVLWGSNIVEPKHEMDSDMMPPPTTLPLGVRRPSISSTTIMSDQLTQQLGLKTEILDENSQSSAPDTMQTDSLDHFSSCTNNNNTVDGSTIKEMQQFQTTIDKQNLDIMGGLPLRGLPMLTDTNSLQNFPTHDNHQSHMSVVDLHAKQEEIAKQLQSQILTVAAAAAVAQNQETVNKFLSSLDTNMNDMKSTNDSMFVNSPTNNSNGLFSPTQMNDINVITTNSGHNIEQTFSQNILTNTNSVPTLTQILNIPQNESSQSVHSPSSNSSSSSSGNSIHSQDIILNSEPAASISSVNLQIMPTESQSQQSPSEHITTELILNPTVSPSMMCPSTTDTNSLISNQVTMANTILNDLNLNAQSTQENLLNNMITDQIHHGVHKTSTVNVNNMILKAAADFITNQEANINSALMSLNTNQILTGNPQTTVTQMLNMPQQQTQTTSNAALLNGNESQRIDICQSQTPIGQHLQHFNTSNVITNHPITTENNNTLQNVSINNMLMNHAVNGNVQNEFMHNLQKANQLVAATNGTTSASQESLLQAVSLVRNELHKPKLNPSVQQLAMVQTTNMGQTNPTQQPTTFPQEITTMSDQDLISYINPSCFDQV